MEQATPFYNKIKHIKYISPLNHELKQKNENLTLQPSPKES